MEYRGYCAVEGKIDERERSPHLAHLRLKLGSPFPRNSDLG